ncbi:xylose isomerase-like protein [Mycena maculata]|uniref:Xylose isomerase-like protein n=1 Tax=Mycena maculata TaxID=230809 RepID=A0AAD7HFS2_9AGAR|nr:xylose isomerase-like protein [Mycena maculata]
MAPNNPKFAISSLSLGSCAHHRLPTKIRAAAALGYDGIEIFVPDFEAFVDEVCDRGLHHELFPRPPTPTDDPLALEVVCAKAIANLCASLHLAIPVLQPLRGFENFASPDCLGGGGLPAALKAAERWIRLMPHFETSLLLVCSNYIEPEDHPFAPFDPTAARLSLSCPRSGDTNAHDAPGARALGKVAARYGVRVGYEPLAWGMVVDNWEQVWDVVRRVGRENVGVILDSFNSLGNQYADPTPRNATHGALLQNLALLARTIPAHKIFLYQLADAASPAPITPAPRVPARMTWSRAARLFPCEDARGAWLPVTDMSLAVVEAGYPATEHHTCGDAEDAWWSVEVFNTSLEDPRRECVEEHGARGLAGLRTLWGHVCGGIAEAREYKQAVGSPTPTPSQDSRSSDESTSGAPVLSNSETPEEISSPISRVVSNEWSLGRVDVDGCVVG